MHSSTLNPDRAKELQNIMVSTIQNLFKDDKASSSLQLIAGAVDGLKNHLENFAPNENEDAEFRSKLYECMVELSDPNKHSNINVEHNRVAFRNMLSIVSLYGYLVSENLFNTIVSSRNRKSFRKEEKF
jgi:hypothetical protein